MVNFFTPARSPCTAKPEAELAADGGITVRVGLPSKPGHNNVPVKEESSAATANCSTFACELETTFGYYHFYALTDGAGNVQIAYGTSTPTFFDYKRPGRPTLAWLRLKTPARIPLPRIWVWMVIRTSSDRGCG